MVQADSGADDGAEKSPDLHERLKEFARTVIEDYCWGYGEPDGASIQDLAGRLGLIVATVATRDDCGEDLAIGDTVTLYHLSPDIQSNGDRSDDTKITGEE